MVVVDEAQRVIRTPDQRVRVFVSSTLGELAAERGAVRDVVERLRLIPVMFELGARPHPPRALYRTYLQQSHVFVGIYWQSYGWVAPGEQVSGLEDEYLLSAGMPRLLYVKEPAPDRQPRLTELLRRIQEEDTATYKKFDSLEQLDQLLGDDLMVLLTESFEAASAGPPPQSAAPAPVRPPQPLTPLLGRDDDVSALTGLLRGGSRLVTLTGTGGIGKTRLALEVARVVAPSFPDGVHFVSLADVRSPEQVLSEVAATLGVPVDSGGSVLGVLERVLAGRRLLLVLDNVEQVQEAAPDIAALLDRCPRVAVLATSRHLLRLRGEQEHRVGPMSLPAPNASQEEIAASPAVQLFVERARAVQPGFRLTAENAADVVAVCTRLDGLPLALELAAARTRLLPPATLARLLAEHADILRDGPVDLPDRQRTLRATIDWSYRLLGEAERTLFARLSVFAGGFTLDAAGAVCGTPGVDLLETLTSLLDKSLLTMPDGGTGEPRLRMLTVLAEYAAERLAEAGERDEFRQRHAEYFLRTAEDHSSDLSPAVQTARTERLDAEAANLRAAAEWWTEHKNCTALGRFAWATFPHYWLRGRLREFDDMLAPAAGAGPDDHARRLLLIILGLVDVERGRPDQAGALADRLLAEPPDDAAARAAALVLRTWVSIGLGRPELVRQDAEDALHAAREAGDVWWIAMAARARGAAALFSGDLELAEASLAEWVGYARAADHQPMLAASLGALGSVALRSGRRPEACRLFTEAAENYRRARSHEGLPFLLEEVAALDASRFPRLAAETLAAAEAMRAAMGITVLIPVARRAAGLRAELSSTLGAQFEAAWRAGQQLDPFVALDRALAVAPTAAG
jgi:predicted ATPase